MKAIDAIRRMRNSIDDMWAVQQYNMKPDEQLESNLVFAINVLQATMEMIDEEDMYGTDHGLE